MSRPPLRPLTGEHLETWSIFATLLEWLPPALDAQLKQDSKMSHFEYGILFALSQDKHRTLRMSTLARYANSTLSRLSRAATRLEHNGWLKRAPAPADGRTTVAILTDSGFAAVTQAAPGHAELVRKLVFDSLTEEQAIELKEISRRITAALRTEEGWSPPGRMS